MKITGYENNKIVQKEMGERLKDCRIGRNLTQQDLAKKAGVSPKTVERMENGENVKLDGILCVMRALGLLSNLDVTIPEHEITLEEALKHKEKRKRVSKKSKMATSWKWGDEE